VKINLPLIIIIIVGFIKVANAELKLSADYNHSLLKENNSNIAIAKNMKDGSGNSYIDNSGLKERAGGVAFSLGWELGFLGIRGKAILEQKTEPNRGTIMVDGATLAKTHSNVS